MGTYCDSVSAMMKGKKPPDFAIDDGLGLLISFVVPVPTLGRSLVTDASVVADPAQSGSIRPRPSLSVQ